jgi:hypothetical protein
MSEQARTRELGNGRGQAQGARESVERYVRSQSQARGRSPARLGRPGPLQFDESGFPLAQRRSSFVERVARLLNPY